MEPIEPFPWRSVCMVGHKQEAESQLPQKRRGVPIPQPHPCRKSKDYDAINLYDDIAAGSVSFHHSLESDLGEREGKFGSFNPLAPSL